MIFLSNAALRYAVDICCEKPRYKIGVAVLRYREDGKNVLNTMREILPIGSAEHIYYSENRKEIHFNNGSIIQIIPASDNSRGKAFHLLIADDRIDPDILNRALRCTEKISMYEYYTKHHTDSQGRTLYDDEK